MGNQESNTTESIPSENNPQLGNSDVLQEQRAEAEAELALTRERDEDIQNLEQSIVEVNAVFQDFHTLVSEQDDALNKIEENVRNAEIIVQEGTRQLDEARKYKKKAKRTEKQCEALTHIVVDNATEHGFQEARGVYKVLNVLGVMRNNRRKKRILIIILLITSFTIFLLVLMIVLATK